MCDSELFSKTLLNSIHYYVTKYSTEYIFREIFTLYVNVLSSNCTGIILHLLYNNNEIGCLIYFNFHINLFCRCGGSLVSRRHVVTAGHCVARATPRQVHVTLGDYVINSAVEPLPAYTFGVSQIQVRQ